MNFFKKYKVILLILSIIFAIWIIFWIEFTKTWNTSASSINDASIDPFVQNIDGSTIIVRDGKIYKRLNWKQKIWIKRGDKVKTIKWQATIFWPDWSITRVWSDSSLLITDMEVDSKLQNIKIKFDLESGKTWSNVIRYMTNGSYFKESYDNGNMVAAVRWTVFEVNLDKNYINAVEHDVVLKDEKNNKEYQVSEWKAIDLKNFLEVSKEFIDQKWSEINKNEDINYIKEKAKQTESNIKNNYKEKGLFTSIKGSINKDERQKITSKFDKLFYEILVDKNYYKIKELEKLVSETKDKNISNEKLMDFYQIVNSYENTEGLLKLKEGLRKLLEETATTEEQKKQFQVDFSKITTYDYLDSAKKWYIKLSDEAIKKFEQLKWQASQINIDDIKKNAWNFWNKITWWNNANTGSENE